MNDELRGRLLSAVRVNSLLAEGGHTTDPELSRELMCTAYILTGGQSLLVFENGRGVFYESREELLRTHRQRVERAKRQYAESVIPDAATFVARVPHLIAGLPVLLGLPAPRLDRTEGSLDVLDRAITKLGAQRVLEPEIFSGLAAYVGEVIRSKTNGAWTTLVSSDGELVPCVIDETGRKFFPSRIYKEILENRGRASVRAFVAAATS